MNSKIKIDKILYIYLNYIIIIWLTDIFDLACFLLKISQKTIISRILILIVIFILNSIILRKIEIKKLKIDFYTLIFIIIIFCGGLIKGIIPDTSYDTINYHIINQYAGFEENIKYNFMPGNFQMFGFRLPDRMFNIFRIILGYRLGTILNTIIIIISYLQIVDIFKYMKYKYIKDNNLNRYLKLILNPSFLAFLIIFWHDIIMQFGSYMVDLFCIPLLLEMIKIILLNDNVNKRDAIYICFLGGIVFTFKMTNIVYIIPLLMIYILNIKKEININLIIKCLFIGLIWVSIYLIYNYYETGNIVFPYYNKIFKSDYYPISNFKDVRWGPSNIKELILWPLYIILKPTYRTSEIINKFPYSLICGYIGIGYFIINKIKNKRKYSIEIKLIVFYILSVYLWAFSTGHVRYFAFGAVINEIIAVMFLYNLINNIKMFKLNILVVNGCILLMLLQSSLNIITVGVYGYEWSWRSLNFYNYYSNTKKVLNDKKFCIHLDEQIDLFLLNNLYGGYAKQIDSNVPIISSYAIDRYLNNSKSEEYNKKIDNYFYNKYNIYDIMRVNDNIEEYINYLNKLGYYINSINCIDTCVDELTLVKLDKLNKRENKIYYIKDENIINKKNSKNKYNFIVGFSDYINKNNNKNFKFNIYNNKEEILYTEKFLSEKYVNISLDISYFDKKSDNIKICFYDENNEIISDFIVINPTWAE